MSDSAEALTRRAANKAMHRSLANPRKLKQPIPGELRNILLDVFTFRKVLTENLGCPGIVIDSSK